MNKTKNLKVTLMRSTAGHLPRHIATVAALGLRRIRQTVQVKDTAAMRGRIDKVAYLLKVEELV